MEYEEINYDEFIIFTDKKNINGNFFYHHTDGDLYVYTQIDEGEVVINIFYSMGDLDLFARNKLDIYDEMYERYLATYKHVHDGGYRGRKSDYRDFKDFIRKKYPNRMNIIEESDINENR